MAIIWFALINDSVNFLLQKQSRNYKIETKFQISNPTKIKQPRMGQSNNSKKNKSRTNQRNSPETKSSTSKGKKFFFIYKTLKKYINQALYIFYKKKT